MSAVMEGVEGRLGSVARVMSTTQLLRLDRVPEAVACEAEEGRMMCWFSWDEMRMVFLLEKEGIRTSLPVRPQGLSLLGRLSLESGSASDVVVISGAGVPGPGESSGVGAMEDSFEETPVVCRRAVARAAASEIEMAEAFLRGNPDLNENF